MEQVKQGDTVKVHYTGKLEDGEIFDSSAERDPLQFTIGENQVIPGFEQAVVGMNLGESKNIQIPSDEAYGPHREEMVAMVERNEFPDDVNLDVGQMLQVRQQDDQVVVVTVADVSESTVTLDANHPLAGKDLSFDIELVEIA